MSLLVVRTDWWCCSRDLSALRILLEAVNEHECCKTPGSRKRRGRALAAATPTRGVYRCLLQFDKEVEERRCETFLEPKLLLRSG